MSPDLFDTTYAAPLGEILGVLPALAITAMSAGVVAHRLSDGMPGLAVVTVTAVIAAGFVACGWHVRKGRNRERLSPAVGLILITVTALVVAFGVGVREELRQSGELAQLAVDGLHTRIDGTVASEPRTVGGRWLTNIRVTGINGNSASGRAAVLHSGDAPALGFGMTFSAQARPLTDSGFHRWLIQQHAAVMFEPDRFDVDGSQPGALSRASETVRARIRDAASRYASADTAGLMVALVTGDRTGIAAADLEAMRTAGMSHLTAVSGMHLAVYSAGVLLLLGAVRARGVLRGVLLGVALVWFVFVTRFQPSVMRAGVMALIVLYGSVRGRVGDARYALCVAVLVLLSVDPRLAASVGLQLSATATAGVLLVAPVVRRRLPKHIPRRIRDVIAVTFGAQLVVLPLLIGTFGEVSLAAFPANLLAVTFALSAAMVGFVGAVGAVIHPAIGSVVFYAATPLASTVLGVARFFGSLPVTVSWRFVLLILLFGLAVVGLRRSRQLRHVALQGAALCLVAIVVVATVRLMPSFSGSDPRLVVTAIDVGQGDAWLVEYGGVRIMVDAGRDDAAARWMRRTGRRKVDLLVLTHPHRDHIAGAVDVLKRLTVGRVWMMTYDDDGRFADEVRATAVRQAVVLTDAPVFRTVAFGELLVSVLNPPPARIYRGTSSEWNNESIVLKVEAPTGSLLLTGDTEAPAHEALLTSGVDLQADVLAVPHHGSASTDLSFLRAVGAHTAIISVGAENTYGHPHQEVLAELAALNMRIVRTDHSGTVSVVVAPVTVSVGASNDNLLGVNDERRYRRTVRRVRPRGDGSRRGGRDTDRSTKPRSLAVSRATSRRSSRGESESHQHCRG
ncbi:MAG: DNA internalization-related competence protein ComEC/Rec2 [Nitriliruptoraceae bacterium]